ncbi:MAG: tetratricopeptide repeat protein [Candidatus Eisenbacteria bacterium]|uniref:Tetratricopeptide repeat protein n=1 Tax=Eiseniibacteriota bacterium TaxID=2212470 RepID=A0A933SBE9_UNCEI|nr:tetratricopeptide repeat protein [Candidatus Eisenbacteria bacterium]
MTRNPSTAVRVASALALAIAVLAAFAGVRGNGWVLIDDPIYVTENPHVATGHTRENLAWFLHAPHGGNWHPLTSWSHLLDVAAFGLDPAGPHFVNLALHVANALLLLFVLRRLTGAWWRSLAVAALFALHPLRVESVAWISERKDVLSGFFFLLTLLAWKRWTEAPSPARYAMVCASLALGLASKPMLVTTPAVLLLLDAWPLDRPVFTQRGAFAARLREKAPLFAIALVFAALTWWVQRATGAMSEGSVLPFATRAANALVTPWRYVWATVWPVKLGVFYPFPAHVAPMAVAASVTAIAACLALAWRERCRRPWLLVGALWFLGMLVPVSGIVQVGRQGWADRYSYLPTIGLAIAFVWTLGELGARWPAVRPTIRGLLAGACVVLAFSTSWQVARWKDSETLFAHTARVAPGNVTALVGLGNAYMKANRPADAATPFREALALEPRNAEVRERLVFVLRSLGRNDEALATATAGLGPATTARGWFDVGELEAKLGRDSLAVEAFARSARLDATQWSTQAAWAEALVRLGRATDAAARFDEALRLSPPNAPLLLQSAWLRATSTNAAARDGALAVKQAELARELSGTGLSDAGSAATLAAAYAEAGRFAEAVAAADSAVAAAHRLGLASATAYLERQRATYRGGRAWRE